MTAFHNQLFLYEGWYQKKINWLWLWEPKIQIFNSWNEKIILDNCGHSENCIPVKVNQWSSTGHHFSWQFFWSFLVLTSGKFLEALGSEIGTGLVFCLSFALSNRVLPLEIMYVISNVLNTYPCLETLKSYYSHAWKSWFSHHRRILSSNSFFSRQKYLPPPFILLGVVHKLCWQEFTHLPPVPLS